MEQPDVAVFVFLLRHVPIAQDFRDGGVVGVEQAQAPRLVVGPAILELS